MRQGRGLWDGSRKAEELADLWGDIEMLLVEIDRYRENNIPADQTFFRIGTDLGQTLAGLGSCERVAIWSMVPV